MTATDFNNALRAEANTLSHNADVVAINGITFHFSDGTEKTITLNADKSWRLKPTVSGDMVRIEWSDPMKSQSNTETTGQGTVYSINEQVETLYLDPDKVVSFMFNYVVKTVTNVEVQSDNSEEE